ncbi:MAG: Bax inhibitor-1/YccA family protein [bacterium]
MSQLDMNTGTVVANASENERASFIKRTYVHLAGAIFIFAILETLLIQSGIAESFATFLQNTKWMWFVVLAVYMGVSMLADHWARTAISREQQYLGLGLFIVAEAVIFMPLIFIAQKYAPDILQYAVILTAALVGAITFTAFTSKRNFSFLGKYLAIGGIIALAIILAAMLFGFSLGLWFSAAMIIFAAVSVLYSTSNIIHEYHTDQHVSASLSLFASIGLLFWYILQFLLAFAGFGND